MPLTELYQTKKDIWVLQPISLPLSKTGPALWDDVQESWTSKIPLYWLIGMNLIFYFGIRMFAFDATFLTVPASLTLSSQSAQVNDWSWHCSLCFSSANNHKLGWKGSRKLDMAVWPETLNASTSMCDVGLTLLTILHYCCFSCSIYCWHCWG